jgi:hypothetical protein
VERRERTCGHGRKARGDSRVGEDR